MSSMSADGHLPPECLGFCGRQLLNITPAIWSPCAACEWGSRTMARNWCEPCRKFIAPYDWMYLGFMALFPFLLHVFFVRRSRKYCRSKRYEILEHLCCVLENLISCVIALMAFPPRFSFSLYGCEKSTWREWYPTYYNPIIDYTKSMRCTYEVVFPLYSLPLFHELLLVAAILVFRTALYCTIMYKTYNGKPFYYAMLSLPIIAGLHALMAGFIYYVFPYCLLLGSVGANVVHLALEGKKTIKEIIVHVFTSPLQIVFLSVNMLLFAFSLVALLSPTGVTNGLFWLLLVPVPLIFYLFTIPFSHPNSISEAESLSYHSCTRVCRRKFGCPSAFGDYEWTTGNCFRCRYNCMWQTVNLFQREVGFTPQFHGKWPFIAFIQELPLGLGHLIIQEPASTLFSMLNFVSMFRMWDGIKHWKGLENKKAWKTHAFIGMATWIASTIFHARDCDTTEYLDYFSAFALILSAFYTSLRLVSPQLAATRKGQRIDMLVIFGLIFIYIYHVRSMMIKADFDYGFNMKVCLLFSFMTTAVYVLYLAIRFCARGGFSNADKTLMMLLLYANASVTLELADFTPVFWMFDAHSLFHLATVPLPIWYLKFLRQSQEERVSILTKSI